MRGSDHHSTGSVLTGHEVVDDHSERVGKITDVIYDYSAHPRPRFAIVKLHALGREHVAALAGSHQSDDGRVVLAYDRSTVKHAPKAPHDHVLTPELEAEVVSHFDLPDDN